MRSAGWLTVLLLPLTAPLAHAQAVDLPSPTGQYGVGTLVFDLTDDSREEVWTPDAGDPRRLVVQLWYPAQPSGRASPAPYVPRADAMKSSLHRFWSDMPVVRTGASFDPELPRGSARFPLLIFSHGMNSSRSFYTSLLQELASHGYIVAAVDHPYWSFGEAFADGTVIRFEDSMVARDTLSSDSIDRMMREGVMTMAADQAFVAQTLVAGHCPDCARIARRIDGDRVAVMGHSMGGMAAQLACLNWRCFRCCVSLDGAVWNPVVSGTQPFPSAKPLLLLLSQQFYDPSPDFARHYLARWADASVFLLKGSRHNSFTDFPLLEAPAAGAADPIALHSRIRRAVTLFLDSTLMAKMGSRPHVAEDRIEGLEEVHLAALAAK